MIWVFVALLVGWGNLGSALLSPTALLPGGSVAFVAAGIALIAAAAAVAWRARLDASELGIVRRRPWTGAVFGLLAGASSAAAGVVALQLAPLITGAPIAYAPLRDVSAAALAVHVLLFLPLGTAIPEEIAFRGVLFGLLARRGLRHALVGSAAAFALWHAGIAAATVDQTTLARTGWLIPAIAGALTVVFVGGVVLAWLRIRMTLASTVAAHWSFNATLLVGLWAFGPAQARSG